MIDEKLARIKEHLLSHQGIIKYGIEVRGPQSNANPTFILNNPADTFNNKIEITKHLVQVFDIDKLLEALSELLINQLVMGTRAQQLRLFSGHGGVIEHSIETW